MAAHDTAQVDRRHVLRSDPRPRMAKASLPEVRKADPEILKAQIGEAIRRTRGALSLKEFADLIDRDERQVARWEKGEDRPQLDAIFAVPALQSRLVEQLAALTENVEIVTTITIRRIA